MSQAIAILQADVARAEDEVFRISQADGFAFTNGSYDRAMSVLRQARRELREAMLAENDRLVAAICAKRDAIIHTLTESRR